MYFPSLLTKLSHFLILIAYHYWCDRDTDPPTSEARLARRSLEEHFFGDGCRGRRGVEGPLSPFQLYSHFTFHHERGHTGGQPDARKLNGAEVTLPHPALESCACLQGDQSLYHPGENARRNGIRKAHTVLSEKTVTWRDFLRSQLMG